MANKEAIKKFILHDRHGHDIDFSSLAVVGEVEVNLGDGIGEPTAESTYEGGKLTINIDNIKGDGIANIDVAQSTEDGGATLVTITCESGKTYQFQVYNGTKGDKGDTGAKGDTVILGNEEEYTLYNTTGRNTNGAMTQAAVSELIADEDEITESIEDDIAQGNGLVLYGTHAMKAGDKFNVVANSTVRVDYGNVATVFKNTNTGGNKLGDVPLNSSTPTEFTLQEDINNIVVTINGAWVTGDGHASIIATYTGDKGSLTRRIETLEESKTTLEGEMDEMGETIEEVQQTVDDALKIEDDTVDTVQNEISPGTGLRYDGQIALKAGDKFYVLAQTNVFVQYGNVATVYKNTISGPNTLGTVSLTSSTPKEFVLESDATSIIVAINRSWVTGTGPASISVIYPGAKGYVIKDIDEIKETIGDTSGFDYLPCPTIYARTNIYNEDRQKYTDKVYPEGFVASPNDEMTIDGGVSMPVLRAWDNPDTTPATKRSETLTINLKKGLATERMTIPVKAVRAEAMQGKKALVLCVGESTTSAVVRNPYINKTEGVHGWPSAMQHFAECDNIDVGNIYVKTLGTQRSAYSYEYTYKDVTFTEHACREGHGGWRKFDFLHYPARFETDEALWSLLGLITKTPYDAASYNGQREEYTGSEAQQRLMRVTSFGLYKMDGSAAAWDRIKSLAGSDGFPAFSGTGSYTGSTAQITAMQNWCNELCASPVNPFYSLDKARTSADGIAFSLEAYLSRYRTLDDEGNRLVGSAGQTVTGQDGNTYTIGTEVTNTSAWDVCTPTHVIVCGGINDSVSGYQDLYVRFMKEIVSQFNVPTAYFVTRKPGACLPAMWAEKAYVKKITADSFSFFRAVLGELAEWFEEQPDKYMLPVYHIQPPCSVLWNFVEPRLDGDGTILNASISNVHPGYDAYRAIGWQCLNWLYYIID